MNVDDVFALLLLVVPGFVVIEVSNAITPRQSMRRSDREKLSGMLMGGLAVFACYLALRGYANVRAGLDSLSPTSAGWPEFGLLFGITVALGLAWGLLKSRLSSFSELLPPAPCRAPGRAAPGCAPPTPRTPPGPGSRHPRPPRPFRAGRPPSRATFPASSPALPAFPCGRGPGWP